MYKSENAPEKMEVLVGDVRDKIAILVDDMIDSGNTLVLAAKTLKENGAKAVYALISHGTSPDRLHPMILSLKLAKACFPKRK